ncbi:hypothetical protein Clacol_002178 [Clathrus columnatus]|uniref:Uncharacterized protein n=1 Tax=Clathrus columnatus TaxID=1419009 RepID=A0AAV5A5X4_9AGAM|nr:hypothetical protein Clacol_002178 [Clathrus columnatus]
MAYPMDMRRRESSLPPDTQFAAYVVSATKTIQVAYKAGDIFKIKHTDLSNDKINKGDGVYSPIPLKGIGANSQANTVGKVTSATPVTKIVYNVDVYQAAPRPINYISSGYIPHNDLREV